MNEEYKVWLRYADENLSSARLLFDSQYYNTCLQNVQQSIEKNLKALVIRKSGNIKRTHSINDLKLMLKEIGILINLTDDEIELIDSIYLPSKYPLGNVLPYDYPGPDICITCIKIADKVMEFVNGHIGEST